MAKTQTKTAERRENGFSIYPDSDTLAMIDKLAAAEDRKRSPMALVLIKKGIEAMKGKAK
jgi:hypothetical protein